MMTFNFDVFKQTLNTTKSLLYFHNIISEVNLYNCLWSLLFTQLNASPVPQQLSAHYESTLTCSNQI